MNITIQVMSKNGQTWNTVNHLPNLNRELQAAPKDEQKLKALQLYDRALGMKEQWLRTEFYGRDMRVVIQGATQ